MMQSGTSLMSNGVRDWLVQRFTAVILGLYFIFLFFFFAFHPHLTFAQWQSLFANPWMKIFSLLALIGLVGHSWVGIWTVITDYLKPAFVRMLFVGLMAIALIAYIAWGIEILWRI